MSVYYPPGTYLGKITNHVLGETSNGNPQFLLQFMVQGKVDPADPKGPLLSCGDQYERTMYRVITDKTIDYVMEDLAKLGFTGESFSELDVNNEVHQDFRGQTHEFYCQHETYDNKERERWGFARGELIGKSLDPKGVRKLDAMFGKQLKLQAKTAKPQEATQAAAESVPQSVAAGNTERDDIPF